VSTCIFLYLVQELLQPLFLLLYLEIDIYQKLSLLQAWKRMMKIFRDFFYIFWNYEFLYTALSIFKHLFSFRCFVWNLKLIQKEAWKFNSFSSLWLICDEVPLLFMQQAETSENRRKEAQWSVPT